MTIYFLSYLPAALKLNGLYIGTIDGFERHIELDPSDRVLAEIVPSDNLQPLNFFLDEKFLNNPPEFADVYLMSGDALIFIREYSVKDVKLNVIFQTRFYGNLVTVFSQGGVYLSIEGAEYNLEPVPSSFSDLRAEQNKIAGRDVLVLYGGSDVIIISQSGRIVFRHSAEDIRFGDRLEVVTGFETCTAAKAERTYSFDGEELTLVSSHTVETRPPEDNIVHFAFFESVLTQGEYANYLEDDLKPKAGHLKSYLGGFVSVTVPPEKFYMQHGGIPAAGLVYRKAKNLYEVKYFAVEIANGKISNIYPV